MTLRTLFFPDEIAPAVSPTEFELNEQHFFYLLPPELTSAEAFYNELARKPQVGKLNSRASPVIQLCPPEKCETTLGSGRIYFRTDKDHPLYPIALRAYNRLARYIRKWNFKTDRHDLYVGPHTAAEWQAGRLPLMASYSVVQSK